MTTEVEKLVNTWAEAERRGDRDVLDGLLTDDFVGIGPVGYVLPKTIWLGRFEHGLRYDELDVDEVSSRQYDDTAVVVARQHARGVARGYPTPEDTRVSIVATRSTADASWKIANIQYSLMSDAVANG